VEIGRATVRDDADGGPLDREPVAQGKNLNFED
jgi:hypothetical protein